MSAKAKQKANSYMSNEQHKEQLQKLTTIVTIEFVNSHCHSIRDHRAKLMVWWSVGYSVVCYKQLSTIAIVIQEQKRADMYNSLTYTHARSKVH